MKRVVVSGLGLITSIGNSRAEVLRSLQEGLSGVELDSKLAEIKSPVKLAGTIKGFEFPEPDPQDWVLPKTLQLSRSELRATTPNVLFAYAAMQEAIAAAQLTPELVSHAQTGLHCASAGSPWLTHHNLSIILERGPARCSPPAVIAGMPNSLHLNLVARYGIKGVSLAFSSACASSSHALGHALDQIRLGRQNIIFVVGAEDCHPYNILPFASLRALSPQTDPRLAPRAFDANRDGFVITGGATVLVLEELDHALARNAPVEAEVIGWGQASDGYDIVAPDPSGTGLSRAMELALADSGITHQEVDYINAHATATLAGDVAEMEAVSRVFGRTGRPLISSTKSLTGHGLSLAGAMEAAFSVLSVKEGFVPVSANISDLDPAAEGLGVIQKPVELQPNVAISNSSGFGGANVCLAFRRFSN